MVPTASSRRSEEGSWIASPAIDRDNARAVSAPRLEELVARYAALIRSAIARVAGPRAEAIGDDVVQRVTTALWKRLGSGEPIEHPPAYVYRCAIREALREVERLDEGRVEPLDDGLADRLGDLAPDPEQRLRGRRLGEAVELCLGDLQPERAQAVRAHLAGFDVDEIMELHAWTYQKARNLVARGMADLRELLTRRGYGDA
jgi:RNA polymerase sigma-70 factor (ECF subfamily)